MTNISRNAPGEPLPSELNKMLQDYAAIAYQATRASDQGFNVSINVELDPEVSEIWCVPEDISRVFINIASNACYATRQKQQCLGSPELYQPAMGLRTRRNGDHVVAAIWDNGDGIPPDPVEKIFNPFFTTKPTNEGTGLGDQTLPRDRATPRRNHHGGHREPGEYTEMRVTLSYRPPSNVQ